MTPPGPYSDPSVSIDLRKGLPDIRSQWILDRGDTEALQRFSLIIYPPAPDDPALQKLRFEHIRAARQARAGMNVGQMHYAKRHHHPEMEYIAIQ